jgi:plasmid replication initiation protein
MTSRRVDTQLDLFVPVLSDLELRDTRDTMERPFFSLSKSKRLKPINYTSPDGSVYVKVLPHQDFGMATIWDADVLIWAASVLNTMKKQGRNDLPRTLRAHPYVLLRAIGRGTGGDHMKALIAATDRLKSTIIKTNIRIKDGEDDATFSWLDDRVYHRRKKQKKSQESEGAAIDITLSNWFYRTVLENKALLAIDPAYFSITGGRERWLYRVVRKHAGGAGPNGIAISFLTLFEKSGAEGTYRRFKFEMIRIIGRNSLPGFNLHLEIGRTAEPAMRMVPKVVRAAPPMTDSTKPYDSVASVHLTELTLSMVRRDFPGWDVYALKAEFDAWLADGTTPPSDYQKAFYGFVRQRHARARA